jgi:hypothetical protein
MLASTLARWQVYEMMSSQSSILRKGFTLDSCMKVSLIYKHYKRIAGSLVRNERALRELFQFRKNTNVRREHFAVPEPRYI